MRTVGRFVIGFVIGGVLFFWSFILAGVGHGSSVPFASAAPFFFLNRDAFVHVGMLASCSNGEESAYCGGYILACFH
jgi:hypothetical protein